MPQEVCSIIGGDKKCRKELRGKIVPLLGFQCKEFWLALICNAKIREKVVRNILDKAWEDFFGTLPHNSYRYQMCQMIDNVENIMFCFIKQIKHSVCSRNGPDRAVVDWERSRFAKGDPSLQDWKILFCESLEIWHQSANDQESSYKAPF